MLFKELPFYSVLILYYGFHKNISAKTVFNIDNKKNCY